MKRVKISELPLASSVSGLYTIGVDATNKSVKVPLDFSFPYIENQLSYGVEIDTSKSVFSVTRIGSGDLHRSLPVHRRMRGCLLNDMGEVVEYLNANDWTGNVRDGSHGQVMVEIPMHYIKYETEGLLLRVRVSEYPLPGYHQVPKMFVSAYEATIQRSTMTLASVVNTTEDYRGGDNTADWDGTYRSLLGRPVSSITANRNNARIYARRRNNNTSSEWNILTYDCIKAIYWLYVIEYASVNSQLDFTSELTPDGYRKGGLGMGATTFDIQKQWESYNNVNPFVPCGYSDAFGNNTGVVNYDALDETGAVVQTFGVPRYRGIENPFGHLMKVVDGVYSIYAETINVFPVYYYACSDPSKFNNNFSPEWYRYVGQIKTSFSSYYITRMIFGEYGDILSGLTSNRSSTAYWCDGADAPPIKGIMYYGGSACYKAYAGLAACHFNLNNQGYNKLREQSGTRLCFIPKY